MTRSVTISKTQHWALLTLPNPTVPYAGFRIFCYAECRYPECHCVECRDALNLPCACTIKLLKTVINPVL